MAQPPVGDGSTIIQRCLSEERELLWRTNQKIFENPELALQEFVAHDTLVQVLQNVDGVRVTPQAYNIATSFEAEYGSDGRVLTYNAEYDALPALGHACGHNLIATTSLGAFLATVEALKSTGRSGRVRILGTPAEESVGGKIKLIEAGAFKDVGACLMMHPTSQSVWPDKVLGDAFDRTMAISGFKVTFRGKPAHAALAPWNGLNALDAAVAGYNNISLLRQQIRPDERIHGIIADGGKAANIIPEQTVLEYGVRAPTLARAQALTKRAHACFKGAAEATGCDVEIEMLGSYADMRANLPICSAFQKAMHGMGYEMLNEVDREITPASTDQGNVSYECPSWHGVYGIPSDGAFPHTAGFAKGAGGEKSFDRAMLNTAGMALTGYQFLTDDVFAANVQNYFETEKTRDKSR